MKTIDFIILKDYNDKGIRRETEIKMKKKKIRKRLEKAIKARQLCKIDLVYNSEETYRFLPLNMSETLVYLIKDGDPAAQGYSIRSLEAIERVTVEDESMETAPKEEDKDEMSVPEVDLTDWPSVFQSLGKLGQVVVVESEELIKRDGSYAIGKIEKVGRKHIGISYYGPDSAWANKKWKIPYEEVTCVTTESCYTEVLSSYAPEGEAEIVSEVEPEPAAEVKTESVPEEEPAAEVVTDSVSEAEPAAGVMAELVPEVGMEFLAKAGEQASETAES